MKNQPLKKFRCGAISATIWENETTRKDGKKGTYLTTSLVRNYQDKEDVWQSTNSLRTQDLHKAEYVLRKAFDFINGYEIEKRTKESDEKVEMSIEDIKDD